MSDSVDALAFALSKIGEPHRHHRHCAHNMTVDEQWERLRLTIQGRKATDEEMEMFGFRKDRIVSITPDDWEIDVPDLDFSRFDGELCVCPTPCIDKSKCPGHRACHNEGSEGE